MNTYPGIPNVYTGNIRHHRHHLLMDTRKRYKYKVIASFCNQNLAVHKKLSVVLHSRGMCCSADIWRYICRISSAVTGLCNVRAIRTRFCSFIYSVLRNHMCVCVCVHFEVTENEISAGPFIFRRWVTSALGARGERDASLSIFPPRLLRHVSRPTSNIQHTRQADPSGLIWNHHRANWNGRATAASEVLPCALIQFCSQVKRSK